jgi:hypothetical protein
MTLKMLCLGAAVAFLVIGSFVAGFATGQRTIDRNRAAPKTDTVNRQYPVYFEEDLVRFSYVQDALNRWATKNRMSVEATLARYAPQAMMVRHQACVQFVPRRLALGGAPPVYCYAVDSSGWPTTQLIFEQSELGE